MELEKEKMSQGQQVVLQAKIDRTASLKASTDAKDQNLQETEDLNQMLKDKEALVQKMKSEFEDKMSAITQKYGVAKEKMAKAKSLIKNVNSENNLYN